MKAKCYFVFDNLKAKCVWHEDLGVYDMCLKNEGEPGKVVLVFTPEQMNKVCDAQLESVMCQPPPKKDPEPEEDKGREEASMLAIGKRAQGFLDELSEYAE